MKRFTYSLFICLLLLAGCSETPPTVVQALGEAERLIELNPDSASLVLQSIPLSEKWNNRTYARWCMLSGKVTDKIFNNILPPFLFERAADWYSSHGTPTEQVQILTYLGRSHAEDGDGEKAMNTYTEAVTIGEEHGLTNLTGYTYSYMGDLYRNEFKHSKAIEKYRTGANNFMQARNFNSYAYALRDLARQYVYIDSTSLALQLMLVADSIADKSNNINVRTSIDNALGNVYVSLGKYDKAKPYFYKALKGDEKMHNYMALIELYIDTDSIAQAQTLLQEIEQDSTADPYSIELLHYLIYKEEQQFEKALASHEKCLDLLSSMFYASSDSKILNIEAKYNKLKIQEELDGFKIRNLTIAVVLAICVALLLVVTIAYLLHQKQTKEKLAQQEEELVTVKTESEILSADNKEMREKMLQDLPFYKKLSKRTEENSPIKALTDEEWRLIEEEITQVYPKLYNFIYHLEPQLSEKQFRYCCFCFYRFDSNQEARLLGIGLDAVKKKRSRLRESLHIDLPKGSTLCDYLKKELG